ncbi:MAG: serine/threonine-protein kinase [bacterium]
MATDHSARVCPECGLADPSGTCPEHFRVLLPANRRARLAAAPLLGYVLDDRFVLVDRIGGGGMSVVYAALQRPLGRLVAVKVLHAQLTATKSARERFEREARTVSLLKSRHTVTLFDFGVSKSAVMPSVAYMVMEYVAGESLAARLKRDGALPPADVARIVRDVGRSLHEAHQKGIVHRDMKPANVILTTSGEDEEEIAKVIDFGIARLEDGAATQTGMLLGTPNYMAPELFEGGREVDGRADIYALGVMTFQMLSGDKPFKGDGGPLGVLWHHANTPVPPLPGAAGDPRLRAVEPVIRRAMAKAPEERYPTVRAMVEAFLRALGEGEAALGEEDVIELSLDDIEESPEVRSLTSQYRLDLLDPDGIVGRDTTSPPGPVRREPPTSRRPGAALEERPTTPRRGLLDPPRVSRVPESEPPVRPVVMPMSERLRGCCRPGSRSPAGPSSRPAVA